MANVGATIEAALKIRSAYKQGGYALALERYFTIKAKTGKVGLIRLNRQQRRALELMERQWQKHGYVRICFLKARQIGFSTLTEGVIFVNLFLRSNTEASIVSYLDEHATYLFQMEKRALEKFPGTEAEEVWKEASVKTQETTTLAKPLASSLYTATAKNVQAGRGKTTSILHGSECAFYPDGGALMGGMLQAIPQTGSIVVIESTACGTGNWFHEFWEMASSGQSDFIPFFAPWHEHEEYVRAFESDEQRETFLRSLSHEELELQRAYSLSDERMLWRSWTIRNNCKGDVSLFRQEYPSYPEEAFLASGRPAFDPGNMLKIVTAARNNPPLAKGYLP